MNTRSAAARDADEFFDFARYGLMLAEQIGDDVTRDNLLKLIRLVGGLTGCQAVNGRAGLMRELIYISLLAGFASGLAAALDRGLFALLFAAAATLTAYAAFRQAGSRQLSSTIRPSWRSLRAVVGGLRHPAPSDWATTFQTKNTRTCSILLRTSSRARQGISSHAARAFLDH